MYDYGLTYKQKFTHESGAAVRSNASFSPACLGRALKKYLLFAPQLEMQPPLPMLSSYSGTAGFTPLPKEIQQLVFREEGTEAMRRSVRCAFPARNFSA